MAATTLEEVTSNKICVVYDFDCTITFAHFSWFTRNINKFLQSKHWIPDTLSGLSDPQQINDRIRELSQTVIDAIVKFNDDPSQIHLSDEDKETFIELMFNPSSNPTRSNDLRQSFDHLTKEGCDLYISSRGDCIYVKWCLKVIDMSNTFKFVNAFQFLGSPIKFDNRNKELDNCKQHGHGKVDFITKYLMPQYNNVIYIDDDKKEHREIASTLDYQQHVDQFVGELGTMIAPMYTYTYNFTTGNYFFINTLEKDGNGMTDLEIWKINEIVRRIKGPGTPVASLTSSQTVGITESTDQLPADLGTNPDVMYDLLDDFDLEGVEFAGGYLKSAQEYDSPTYYDMYEYWKQIYLDLKYHLE